MLLNYDNAFFDQNYRREGTASVKWDFLFEKLGYPVNPMWVADMDFQCLPEVTKALQERSSHRVYGYTEQTNSAVHAMLAFMERRHHLVFSEKEQIQLPCVISGLRAAVLTFTQPGDQIIVQPPVYGPFYASIEENGREAVHCPLLKDSMGYYTMDLTTVENACRNGAKMMMLCSPHNPVGRCWKREELRQLIELLAKYNVLLVSDEIHEDIVFEKDRFISILSLDQPKDFKAIALTSISKTFNLAGLQQAVAFSRDESLLSAMARTMRNVGVVSGNIFALTAFEAAYTYGDAWLDGALQYIAEGEKLFRTELSRLLPKAILTPLEATYLGWIDLNEYGFSSETLVERCRKAGVELNAGTIFGKEGEGFLRINYACPHFRIKEAATQLANAVLQSE